MQFMETHWQEIAAIVVVLIALIWTLRRFARTWRNVSKGSCGCDSKCCGSMKPEKAQPPSAPDQSH